MGTFAFWYAHASGDTNSLTTFGWATPDFIVGRVTMNTVMVDVTDFADVQMGDEVVLYGKQSAAEITSSELEEMAGRFCGPFLAGLSLPRCPTRSAMTRECSPW